MNGECVPGIASNGLAKQRRSRRVSRGKGRQETVSGPKGMGEKTSGVEQTDTDKTGNQNGKKAQRRENRGALTREKEQ